MEWKKGWMKVLMKMFSDGLANTERLGNDRIVKRVYVGGVWVIA